MAARALHVTLLVALASSAWAYQHQWRRLPYTDENFRFNVEAPYLSNTSLSCNDTGVSRTSEIPDEIEVLYWILPIQETLEPGNTAEFNTLDGMASWYVEPNPGIDLRISLVQEEHFGYYQCVCIKKGADHATAKRHVIKRALNIDGPVFTNLWPKYRRATAISLGSVGGWVALWVIGLTIYYTKCSRDEKERDADAHARAIKAYQQAYENAGFTTEKPYENSYHADVTTQVEHDQTKL